jgi:hypothetical protein
MRTTTTQVVLLYVCRLELKAHIETGVIDALFLGLVYTASAAVFITFALTC